MPEENKNPQIRVFHQGQAIFKEGAPATEAYLIKSGAVILYRVIENKRVLLERLAQGQMLGEMGVITNQPRASHAMAEDYCELLIIDKGSIAKSLADSPKIVQKITARAFERLKAISQQVRPHQPLNLFLSVCNLLKLMWQAKPPADPRAKPNGDGLPYQEVVGTIKEILGLTILEVEEQVKRLRSLKAVHLTFTKRKENLWDCLVHLPEPEKMMDLARGFVSEVADTNIFAKQEQEFIDLLDFSQMVGGKPELLLKKIGAGELPLSLLFLPKKPAEEYAAQMGQEFFRKVAKLSSRFADMAGVDDLVEVDDDTLQQVFSELGYAKLVTLYVLAGPAAQEKILSNLSRSTARIVRDEANMRPAIDRDEAADVEYEAITMIKRLKGVIK